MIVVAISLAYGYESEAVLATYTNIVSFVQCNRSKTSAVRHLRRPEDAARAELNDHQTARFTFIASRRDRTGRCQLTE